MSCCIEVNKAKWLNSECLKCKNKCKYGIYNIALYPDAQSALQHFVGDFCQTAYLGANCSHAWVSVSVVNNTRIVYLLLLCCHVFGKIPFFKRYYAKNGRLIPTAKSGSLKTLEHSCRVLEFCLWDDVAETFFCFLMTFSLLCCRARLTDAARQHRWYLSPRPITSIVLSLDFRFKLHNL